MKCVGYGGKKDRCKHNAMKGSCRCFICEKRQKKVVAGINKRLSLILPGFKISV